MLDALNYEAVVNYLVTKYGLPGPQNVRKNDDNSVEVMTDDGWTFAGKFDDLVIESLKNS